MSSNFFSREEDSSADNIQLKLQMAISNIHRNKSLIAKRLAFLLSNKLVTIRSLHKLSKAHYLSLMKDEGQNEPNYPPQDEDIKFLETKLNGVTFKKTIYLNSSLSARNFEITLVHELMHIKNSRLCKWEARYFGCKDHAFYRDEVRARLAEISYVRQGKYVFRKDVSSVHKKVSKMYPEFSNKVSKSNRRGHIYMLSRN